MAALRYMDEHNKVGYLLKPTGSDDYHQIIDFLRASHTRYALTHNPIIFDSSVKQFWSTATLRSPELGPSAIQATIDETPYTISKDLVRSQLQFTDDGGIDDLPIAEIYSGMDNLGYVTEGKLTFSRTSFHLNGETELKDHKKLFKDVVGKLVKKVKALEVKLRTTKRNIVASDFDHEEGGKQDVDMDALLALANAAMTVDSNIPPGGASNNLLLAQVVAPTGISNKGKTPMVEEDITVKERTFKQMKDDKFGEQAAKRLHDEKQAQVDRQRAELQRRRQQEVLASAMYYTEANWINIMAQVEANASLSKTLLSDDVWSMAYVKSFSDDQLKEEFEKIQKVLSNIQIQAFSKTLKKTGPVLKEPSSKRQKSTKAHIPFVHEVPQSPVVSSPKYFGTRRKSLGRKRLTKPKSTLKELDLDANDQTFIKVVSNEDSEDETPLLWSALIGWEVITTPLEDINALYRIDWSIVHFTTLREILHMVDRQDLVLFDSHEGGKGSFVWNHQLLWQIRSWRLYTISNVHVLETVSGEVVYMFADVSYPFSIQLIERMLKHKLEIDKDVVGNDMTTAEQLIQLIKNQFAAAKVSLA
nr:hypothetical protein [Tanacetum cinerariifolium]